VAFVIGAGVRMTRLAQGCLMNINISGTFHALLRQASHIKHTPLPTHLLLLLLLLLQASRCWPPRSSRSTRTVSSR